MCNKIHWYQNCVKIPEHGIGYKLFAGWIFDFRTLTRHNNLYPDKDGWVHWNPTLAARDDDGFCFFVSNEGAVEAAKRWGRSTGEINVFIAEIEYTGGIAEFDEDGMFGPDYIVRSSICKSYKITKQIWSL